MSLNRLLRSCQERQRHRALLPERCENKKAITVSAQHISSHVFFLFLHRWSDPRRHAPSFRTREDPVSAPQRRWSRSSPKPCPCPSTALCDSCFKRESTSAGPAVARTSAISTGILAPSSVHSDHDGDMAGRHLPWLRDFSVIARQRHASLRLASRVGGR